MNILILTHPQHNNGRDEGSLCFFSCWQLEVTLCGTGKECPTGEGHLSRARGSCTALGLCLTLNKTEINCNSCSGMREEEQPAQPCLAELPSFIQCWCCWTWIAPQNLLPSRRMPGCGSAWGLQEPWDPSCLCSPRAERGGLSCATRVWQCHIPAELGHTRSCLESWQGRIREL